MSGRDGHTDASSESEVERRGQDGADHTEHEQGGGLDELVDVDNLSSDGVGDTTTNTDGTGEFEDRGTAHGLEVGQRPGGDGRGPGVGDIVGTNVPGVEEGEDGSYREEVIVLVERHLDGCVAVTATECIAGEELKGRKGIEVFREPGWRVQPRVPRETV